MSIAYHPKFLRSVLVVDAVTCLLTGLLMTIGADAISNLTQVPAGLLLYAGLSLFPIAAFIAFVATRTPLSAAAVWLVIVGNIAWVAGSLWLSFGSSISPNTVGVAFLLFQALAVAVLTELEYMGVRRASAAA